MEQEIQPYVSEDSLVKLEVRVEEETVWLTQSQIADLFQKDRSVITRHINNIFAEGELEEGSNVHFLHIANADRHLGASLKDLGRKWFAFSRMEVATERLLETVGAGEREVAGQ